MSKKAQYEAGATSIPKKKEKQDEAIIGTNDYSIVSKRSVEKLYLQNEPQFFRPFIEKPKRRAPLINRGYWLRMQAIEHVVKMFLNETSPKDKVVINLGCGYEPLPFRMLWKYKSLCGNVKFIDFDFPQLMRRKVSTIRKYSMYTDLVEGFREEGTSSHSILMEHERYSAIGCDLGNTAEMRNLFLRLQLQNHAVIFLAEVSMVYMEPAEATNLIRLCGELPDARFCMLEQHLPSGLDHPFAKTMTDHFNKQTPLRALTSFPTIDSQRTRFQACGWSNVGIRNLWDLWQDSLFIDDTVKSGLDHIEPFDEWEELALFAGHYFLLTATTSPASKWTPLTTSTIFDTAKERLVDFKMLEVQNPKGHGQRRLGAIIDVDKDSFAHHGGIVSTKIQSGLDLYAKIRQSVEVVAAPEHLLCHTITTLHDGSLLFAGGRKSPASPSAACYTREDGKWTKAHDLKPARYRHCSVAVTINSQAKLLVFGGKDRDGSALALWQLYDHEFGWKNLECDNKTPAFGASMVATSKTSGVLFGGMSSCGTLISQYVEWRLIEQGDSEVKLECKQIWGSRPELRRFGACLVQHPRGLIVIGGIGPNGVLEADEEIMLIRVDGAVQKTSAIPGLVGTGTPRPMLTGHSAKVVDDEVIIFGGGGVCFSFGAFWNEKHFILRSTEDAVGSTWRIMTSEAKTLSVEAKKMPTTLLGQKAALRLQGLPQPSSSALQHAQQIPHAELSSPEDFQTLVATTHPIVIRHLDLGPCLDLWTPRYLKDKIDPDRSVIIHVSKEPHLSFSTKNFTYETQPFGKFIDAAMNGEYVYLRALSSENPSKLPAALGRDFPTISDDFVLPDVLKMAKENEHSSVLRVSGNTTMWLHYDVMANILCQIRGSKRVVLFPPGDVSRLEFVHGETTSGLNVFTTTDEILANTHPVETILKQGEVLFIPACWAHATGPAGEGSGSVAVNVFFRSFEEGVYAAGRDVYGNRDLGIYQNGRRDIAKIMERLGAEAGGEKWERANVITKILGDKGFRREVIIGGREIGDGSRIGAKEVLRILKSVDGVPKDVGQFYLDRLAVEMEDLAKTCTQGPTAS
ncbi:LCM-domain-containing protein [Venturia nashicola]|uniref:tRNA wybutosine-synthesizing protein 4 n=1 Tax=Venturia nashicola TaxID=86259 RepID=A0A4Z1P9G1_9PEZI|nr:LCM-domain-containing protein [Venturia nashicola]